MDRPSLLRSLRDHTGLPDDDAADELLRHVLWACSPLVPRHARQLLAPRLPDEWLEALTDDDPDLAAAGPELLRRLASLESTPPSIAREQAAAVLSHLVAYLDEAGAHALRSELPEDVQGWLGPVDLPSVEPSRPPRPGHHLADGRPGPSRPIAEARPRLAPSPVPPDGDE